MELELKEYLGIISKKWWIIMMMIVLCCGSVIVHDYYMTKPLYEASTKLIVNNTNRIDGPVRLDSGEITSNIMLINTYKDIIKSSAIMDKVIMAHPEIVLTSKQLIDNVRVVSSSNSQVMSISIRDYSLQQAVQIANAISEVFKREIPTIMSVDNVTILSAANAVDHPDPVSPSLFIKVFIALVISFIISLSFIFLREYLDDTIKSEKDVRVYLDQPTLAMVAKVKASEWKNATDYATGKVGIEPIQHGANHHI